jgi:DNA-binding NarL/FixJ family response regulator
MPSHPITVAFVDDSPRDKSFVQLALSREDDIHLIGQARCGEEIAALMQMQPDVLLLDVLLPRTASADSHNPTTHNDHYEILNTIEAYASKTRILIFTNCERRFDLMRQVDMNRVYGYLWKYDTTDQQLITAIRNAYAGEKTVSGHIEENMRELPSRSDVNSLTKMEIRLLRALGEHRDCHRPLAEAAVTLDINRRTARNYATVLYAKLGLDGYRAAIRWGEEAGVVSPRGVLG